MMKIQTNWHKLSQLNPLERHVELTCSFPDIGFKIFLIYTLLQQTVCAILAFKTRHLPDNFNESKFISMCVSTTMLLMICFIPAFTLSTSETLKILILVLVIGLNHTVALTFLFIPKVYAVFCVDEKCTTNLTFAHDAKYNSRGQPTLKGTVFPTTKSDDRVCKRNIGVNTVQEMNIFGVSWMRNLYQVKRSSFLNEM